MGCIGMQFDELDTPMVADIKGFANTPPKGVVQQAAGEVFQRLQRVDCDRDLLQARHLLEPGRLAGLRHPCLKTCQMIEAAIAFRQAPACPDGYQRSSSAWQSNRCCPYLRRLPQIAPLGAELLNSA
jgi:hypothetical protein